MIFPLEKLSLALKIKSFGKVLGSVLGLLYFVNKCLVCGQLTTYSYKNCKFFKRGLRKFRRKSLNIRRPLLPKINGRFQHTRRWTSRLDGKIVDLRRTNRQVWKRDIPIFRRTKRLNLSVYIDEQTQTISSFRRISRPKIVLNSH